MGDGASLEGPSGRGRPAAGQEHGVLVPLAAGPQSKEPPVQADNLTSQVTTDPTGGRPACESPVVTRGDTHTFRPAWSLPHPQDRACRLVLGRTGLCLFKREFFKKHQTLNPYMIL